METMQHHEQRPEAEELANQGHKIAANTYKEYITFIPRLENIHPSRPAGQRIWFTRSMQEVIVTI